MDEQNEKQSRDIDEQLQEHAYKLLCSMVLPWKVYRDCVSLAVLLIEASEETPSEWKRREVTSMKYAVDALYHAQKRIDDETLKRYRDRGPVWVEMERKA